MKVGFLCEGNTEVKIVKSNRFQQYLTRVGIEMVVPILDAEGGGNLTPGKSGEYTDLLIANGADRVIILTDLDDDSCISLTKSRITTSDNIIVIVAVRQIEAWFLADSNTLSHLLKENFEFERPEEEADPFETLKNIFLTRYNRGIGGKDIFTRRMLKYGFSIENAAQHPNCPSAAYFLKKLKQLAEN